MDGFPKKYDHTQEEAIYKDWLENGSFKPEKQKGTKGEFVIPMPPPNVTGVLHLGHALMLAVQDAMTRYARMNNKRTLYIPGTDHASISTEVVVINKLKEKGLDKFELGRTEYLKHVWDWVEQSRGTIVSQSKRMGTSCDRSREQFTMSEQLSRSVRKAFIKLYNEKKIYKDAYMVNRSPKAKTVLSDLEVEYKEVKGKMYYIKYFVDGKGNCITIATVRPETMFADVAIAVHPKDKRYKKWIGRNILIPIINKSIPIIADEEVDMELGTGALKITPTHSEVDYHIAVKHNLPLDNYAIDKEAKFTELAGEMFAGKNVDEFTDNLIHQLKEIGNLDRIEDHTSSVPFCERTGCRVEPFLSTQRFMDVAPAAHRILGGIEEDKVQVHPARFKKTFSDWLLKIRPRCISRQLRWGHRIPVWTDEEGNQYAFEEETVLEKTRGKKTVLSRMIFNLVADSRLTNPFSIEQLIEVLLSPILVDQHDCVADAYISMYKDLFSGSKQKQSEIQEIEGFVDGVMRGGKQKNKNTSKIISFGEKFIDMLEKSANIVQKGDTYLFQFLPSEPKKILTQEEDVLDTRFSSGLWPFSILGWPEETKDLSKFYPNTVLETGYDIIFFRVIRMMIMGVELTDKLPFEHVYLHGMVRDKHGKKMSKSKGNTTDPLEMINKYGADALRGSLLIGNTPGSDLKFSEEKVEYTRKFINKIWNASRFVLKQIEENGKLYEDYDKLCKDVLANESKMNDYDIWIFGKVQELIKQVERYQSKFMIGESVQEVIHVVWHDFCDWYIEISKIEPSEVTSKILLYCLGTFYKLLHPSLPFVSEKLWNLVGFEGSLMMSSRPEMYQISGKNYRMNLLMDMISQWRKLKVEVTNKPHENVDIFVQANKDIQDLVKNHFTLIKEIVRVENAHYLSINEELEGEWQVAMIMDIKVGLKGIKEVDKKELLKDLEGQLVQEQQFLQRLRSMFTGDFASKAPDSVIQQKKEKMQEMKAKVAGLEAEIRRVKLEMK